MRLLRGGAKRLRNLSSLEKTLLLVDGSSYLYRAFHALPDLRNAAGEPTGAIYGVLNMLRRLLADYKADYLACVFEARGKTFRDEMYAQYKANRPPMPDDLGAQVEPLLDAIRASGWPLLQIEGVEADDVIGTLAREAEKGGLRCVISTGDKDLAQLVTDRVTLVNTMSNERLDPAGVKAKFGVPPERMLDYLTLVGDSVDNVPGVDKVGPKTAAKWLEQYGSLEEVVRHAGEIGGAVGENLRKALGWLPQAQALLAVKCDLELPGKLEELKLGPRDEKRLAELISHFGFKTWLKETAGDANPSPLPATSPSLARADREERRYETLVEEVDLARWLKDLETAELVAFDTETTSLDPMQARLVGMSFCVVAGRAAYLPLEHNYAGAPGQLGVERALAMLKPWLENEARKKLGQNIKYDQHVLANHGIVLRGIAHDTLLESYVLESHARHDMDSLASRHLGLKTLTYDEVTGTGVGRIPFEQVDVARAAAYAAEDADLTLRIHHALYPKLEAAEKLLYVYRLIELPAREVLFRMERDGVLIDAAQLEAMSHELGQKMLELESKAHEEAGQPFNLGSPKQIAEIFFEKKGMPVIKKTPSGVPSTDEDVLEKLALDHPLAKMLLDYREISKLKSTYTDKLPKMVNPRTGRVHTNYGQATAVTGRLASNDPNLQNIPVRTPEERRYAKVINFGLIYGMSAFGLAQQLGLERATAQAYIASYFTRYPGVAKYMEEVRKAARDRGYVETVFGRRLWLPEIKSSNPARRGGAERAAINAPMQGTAADLIKLAMIAVRGWLDRERLSTKLIMQVHDELVLEAPEDELARVKAEIPELMSGVAKLKIPLVVDVGSGQNWEKAH